MGSRKAEGGRLNSLLFLGEGRRRKGEGGRRKEEDGRLDALLGLEFKPMLFLRSFLADKRAVEYNYP